ncbi:type II secretion system secretin GspD [Chitinilyticum aquatile]|uniref:type II secretion system secretin GspD n=1 Tax=Chitinilyticum aquatile TaxID=362520 RepID=UPI00041499F5|nr:type II secretion system secretin GspD [Chitinilyticum aquatile]
MKINNLLLSLMLCASLAQAASDGMLLNFVNLDLEQAAKVLAELTHRNVVIDPKAKGTLNVISSRPLDSAEAYQLFLSALRSQGLTALDDGVVLRIVPDADAKQQAGPVLRDGRAGKGNRVITQLVRINNNSAPRLVEALRPFVSTSGALAASPGDNSLIITDYADNVARLSKMVDALEAPESNEIFMLKARHASAVTLAGLIAKVMPEVAVQGASSTLPPNDGARRSVIVPDAASNTLVIRAISLAHGKEIRRLVDALDQPEASNNFRVIYLKNADASRLVETLRGVIGARVTNLSSSGSTPGKEGAQSGSAGVAISGQLDGLPVSIQADTSNNALLISAPEAVFQSLKLAIEALDVRRAQVFVEAMIAEINTDRAGELGFQWLFGGLGDVSALGAIAMGTGKSNLGNLLTAAANKDPSGIPNGMTLGLFNGDPNNKNNLPSIGLIASALEQDGLGNVLSAPTLMMLDNEEAKIQVGQNIPIITGSQPSTGSNPNPFITVERKDVGVMLKVRPQVSEGGTITLNIEQEVSAIDPTVQTGNAGIATRKREVRTRVLVQDGQMVTLGGLLEEKIVNTQSKVPFLGDIPGGGFLFRNEQRGYSRTNLVVFLRPMVVRDSLTASTITNQRYQQLRTQQGEYSDKIRGRSALPDVPAVQLPVTPGVPQ